MPGFDLFLRLVGQGFVDDVQQSMVLPHAEAERDGKRRQGDDQASAQLMKMVDHAEPVFMSDRAYRGCHDLSAR